MMHTSTAAGPAGRTPDEFKAFLLRLGDRDRQNIERHVAFCEVELTLVHANAWKRVACLLARLAPYAAHTTGQRAVRFFIADGKYRLQTFALEDLRDGNLVIYTGNMLKAGVDAQVIRGPLSRDGETTLYEVCDDPSAMIEIEVLTTANTTSAPDYYRHMLGWNRSALRIRLNLSSNGAAFRALEALCTISARNASKQ